MATEQPAPPPRKRGRKPIADRRIQRQLNLNDAEWAKVERRRHEWTRDLMEPGPFLRALVLAALNSNDVHATLFMDSGALDQEEAEEAAEAMAEYEALQAAPPWQEEATQAPGTPAERT